MSRQRETFNATQITAQSMRAVVEGLVRHAGGDWTFHLKLAGEARLPDGRRVMVGRRFRVKATDTQGRRPRGTAA